MRAISAALEPRRAPPEAGGECETLSSLLAATPPARQAASPVPECPSVGSMGHPHTCADACKYQFKHSACKDRGGGVVRQGCRVGGLTHRKCTLFVLCVWLAPGEILTVKRSHLRVRRCRRELEDGQKEHLGEESTSRRSRGRICCHISLTSSPRLNQAHQASQCVHMGVVALVVIGCIVLNCAGRLARDSLGYPSGG